jgi:hypothetical protein
MRLGLVHEYSKVPIYSIQKIRVLIVCKVLARS